MVTFPTHIQTINDIDVFTKYMQKDAGRMHCKLLMNQT